MDSGGCLKSVELRQILGSICPPLERSRYEQHIDSCEACRRRLEDLSGTIAQYTATSRMPAASSTVLAEVMDGLLRMHPATDPGRFKADSFAGRAEIALPYLAPSDRTDSLGRLGKYEIKRLLGRGGMGVVFAALDPLLGREVAIKVPAASVVGKPETQGRFLREARALAAVRHDNIVTVFAAEELDGTLILVMELVDGESLADRLCTTPKLGWQEVVRIGQEVAAALEAAHAMGVVHRDLTPANVLLETNTGRVKVMDFGLARAATDRSITSSGVLAGTPDYMSPEQATEGTVGAASDLFSLGAVLYEACSGVSPFRGKTVLSTLRRVCEEIPRPLHELDSAVPGWFSLVVQQLLAKDPLERPRSAAQARELLANQGQAVETPIDAPPCRMIARPTRRRGLAICGMVALGCVLSISAYFAGRNPPRAGIGFFVESTGKMYRSLGEALDAVADGDVIEVRGNGPFHVEGYSLGATQVTIRAAAGSWPVFLNTNSSSGRPFLHSQSNLHLEGIDVRWGSVSGDGNRMATLAARCVVSVAGANVTLTRCRLTAESGIGCLGCQSESVELAGSHLISSDGPALIWLPSGEARLVADHCVLEGRSAIVVLSGVAQRMSATRGEITLQNNSFSGRAALQFVLEAPLRPFDVVSRRNAFDTPVLLMASPDWAVPWINRPISILKRHIFRKLNWTEAHNAYRLGIHFIERGRPGDARPDLVVESSLDGWLAACGSLDAGSFEAEFKHPELQRGLDTPGSGAFANIRVPSNTGSLQIGADLTRVGPGGPRQVHLR